MGLPRVTSGRVPGWRLRLFVPAVLLASAALAHAQEPAPPGDAPKATVAKDKRYSTSYRNASWNTVFDWFEKESGYRILSADQPPGTASITIDNKTLPEVVDQLNDLLGTVKYVMVLGSESFSLFPADKPIPNEYVRGIDLADLPKRAKTEWVRVIIPLPEVNAAEVVPQLAKFKSQFGDVSAVGNNVVVTDKVATVRQIAAAVATLSGDKGTESHVCKYVSALDAAAKLRQSLKDATTEVTGGPPEPAPVVAFNPNQQGGDPRGGRAPAPEKPSQFVSVVTNEETNTVIVNGPAKKIADAKEFFKEFDKPSAANQQPRIIGGQVTLQSYAVEANTAEQLVKFLKERYAGSKFTNVQSVGTDRVMVVALPADQMEIAATLKGQGGAPGVESKLFTLNLIDITKTAEALTKALGGAGLTAEARTDGVNPGILVRGSPAQLREAAEICKQLGEAPGGVDTAPAAGGFGKNTRTIIIDRGNTTVIAEGLADLIRKLRPRTTVEVTAPGAPARPAPKPDPRRERQPGGEQSRSGKPLDPKFVLAQKPDAPAPADKPLSIIVVGNKVILSCDDPEVLDLATQVARTLLSGTGEDIYEVIRLRNASAETAAKELNEIFNGPAAAPGAAAQNGGGRRGGFSPFSLLGLGGGDTPSVSGGASPNRVRLVADPASNSIVVVKASPADLLQIRSLLARAIDYDGPPEGGVAKTRTIPLEYAKAEAVRDAILEVFRNKTTRASVAQDSGNPFRPPQQVASGPAELSVYADVASNRLVVNSTEADFLDVRDLAKELDKSTESTIGVARVVKLNGLTPMQVKTAVEALTGKKTEEKPAEDPFSSFFRRRGRSNRSSLDRGGRDFFDSRGTDAPRLTNPLFDPEVAARIPTSELTPSVFNITADLPGSTPITQVQAQEPPKGPVEASQVVQPSPAGNIEIVPLDELGAVIIRGKSEKEIQEVIRFIEFLRVKTADTEIVVKTIKLKVADATALTDLLVKFYQRVQLKNGTKSIVAAPEQQNSFFSGLQTVTPQTVGNLVVFPLPQFNEIVVAAPKADIDGILEQIQKFDQPNAPELKPVRYQLTRASAQVVQRELSGFFLSRYGQTSGLTSFTYDIPSNSILVQATPGEQAEIGELIRAIDSTYSNAVNNVEVIRLKNAFADEIAEVINQAINVSVINPLTAGQPAGQGQGQGVQGSFGQQVFGGGGGGGGNQGGNQNQQNQQQNQAGRGATGVLTGITTKTTTLRLVGGPGLPVESGALEDVHVVPVSRVNGLLIAAPPKTMELIKRLVAELDVVSVAQSNINVFTLKKADAVQVAGLLQQLFSGQARTQQGGAGGQQGGFGGGQQGGFGGGQQGGFGGGAQGGAGGAGGTQGFIRPLLTLTGNPSDGANLIDLRLAADPRTNTIIVAGSQNDLQTINAIIARIDSADAPAVVPTVYKLRHAAAADVAQAVTNFVTSQAQLINSQFSQNATFQTLQRNLVVVGEPVSNTLLISATPQLAGEIGRLIAQLDAAPPQVLVQVLIAEVTLNNNEEFGVELGFQSPILFSRSAVGATPGTPGFNFNSTAPLGNATNAETGQVGFQGLGNLGVGRAGAAGVGGFVFSAASDSVSVLVRALKVQSRIDVLSRPQLVLTDNQQGFFQVGQSFPYIAGSTLTATGVAQQNVLYRDIGVVLRVVPRISPEGRVLLRVEPQVSAVSPTTINLGNGINAPAFNVQTLQTTVNAGNGETVILGGLIQKSDTKVENKIPVLGDIPYVGSLFRYRTQALQRRELIFVLTPHIIRSELDHARLTAIEACKSEYNRKDVLGVHTYGTDVLAAPCGPGGTNPACNPTLDGPAGFPYNSPALDPNAPIIEGLPPGATVQPDGTVVMPATPNLLSPQAEGFPLRNKNGTPTPFAPPGTPNQLPQDAASMPAAASAAATTPKDGNKPWNWTIFGK